LPWNTASFEILFFHSKPLQCPATSYFSLVMSRGKRFESARPLS
jgi:hypothetical protein